MHTHDPGTPQNPALAPAVERTILATLVAQYLAIAMQTFPVLVAGNCLVVAVFFLHYRDPLILAVGAASLLLPTARYLAARRYFALPEAARDPARAEVLVFRQAILTSLVFAAYVWVLFREGSDLYNAMLCLWAVMIISGTIGQSASLRRALIAFGAIMGGALVLRLALVGDFPSVFGALVCALFSLGQLMIGLKTHALHVTSLRQSHRNDALAQQLESQVRIAEAAREEALRASREKSRFLAAATHDLRQPLHALALTAAALHARSVGTPQEADTSRVVQSVQALDSSLDAMLDLSLLDSGTVVPRIAVVPLAEVFGQLQRNFLQKAEAKGLGLRFRAADAFVRTDRQFLTELLGNLVDNAVKYTPSGGVLVAARRRPSTPGLLTIEVRDSGIGIPDEHRAQVFEAFFQVDNPGRERSAGLGLGLSIVERLARLLHLPLALRSAPGRGTCFELLVPLAAADEVARHLAAQPRVQEAAQAGALRGRKALVVDPDPVVLQALRTLLEQHGMAMQAAAGPGEALAAVAEDGDLDVVLLDHRLGAAGSCTDLAAALKGRQQRPLQVVIVTGDTGSQEIRQLRGSGSPVLHKPVSGDRLVRLLASLFEPEPQREAASA